MPGTAQSDSELLLAVRRGDQAAVAELYARHHAAARRLAATTSGPSDSDDLVNEAFEKVFGAIRRDAGPTEAFRAYLFVTIRRLAARHAAQQQDDPYDEVPEPVAAVQGSPLDANERAMVTQAFTALPERWQAVLWHTAVEGRNPREVADVLGMSANAVSALAYRAREKLRQSYLQAHLQAAPRPGCEPHRSALGAYVRDGLGKREQAATAKHIDDCASCQALIQELDDVNQLLARAILPLFVVETIGEAVAGPVAAAVMGPSDVLDLATESAASAGPPEVLGGVDAVEAASAPARRLAGLLPEGLSTGQLAGAGVATLALVIALGAGGSLLLEGDTAPGPEVVTDDGDSAAARTPDNGATDIPAASGDTDDDGAGGDRTGPDFNNLSATEIAEELGCIEQDGADAEVDASAEVGAESGSGSGEEAEAGSGSLLDVEIGVGVTLGEALSIDDEDDLPPEIRNVTCDDSSGQNELVVTLDSETVTTTTVTTEADTPDSLVDIEADVSADPVPSVVPEVEVGAEASVNEDLSLQAGVDTNLDELCDPDEDGNLVCRLDEELLNGLVGDTLGALGDAGVEIEVEGGGGSTATIAVGDGDASVEAEPGNLLPGLDQDREEDRDQDQNQDRDQDQNQDRDQDQNQDREQDQNQGQGLDLGLD